MYDPTPDHQAAPDVSHQSPLDAALLMSALRSLVRTWRERTTYASAEQAAVYRQTEEDLTELIHTGHPERRATWGAARDDLIRALVRELEWRFPGGVP